MRKRKSVGLCLTAIVAMVAIFAGGGAFAASSTCLHPDNAGSPSGECVNLDGYDVRVIRTDGQFPELKDGNSVYTWSISPVAGKAKSNVNTIDIKITAAVGDYANLRSSMEASIIKGSTICSLTPITLRKLTGWALSPAGVGDLTTSIGRFEHDYYVFTAVPPTSPAACVIKPTTVGTKIELIIKGKTLSSGPNTFLVRASFLGEALNLLGPSTTWAPTSTPEASFLSGESCILGATGCKMVATLNFDGSLKEAVVVPVGPSIPAGQCGDGTPLQIEDASRYFDCEKDASGNPINCKQRRAASTSTCEELSGSCVYKYTVAGRTVTKTIPDPCTPQ